MGCITGIRTATNEIKCKKHEFSQAEMERGKKRRRNKKKKTKCRLVNESREMLSAKEGCVRQCVYQEQWEKGKQE